MGHLLLTRKEGERVRIDGPCEVIVRKINQNRVRLEFEAPATTRIVRSELPERAEAHLNHPAEDHLDSSERDW